MPTEPFGGLINDSVTDDAPPPFMTDVTGTPATVAVIGAASPSDVVIDESTAADSHESFNPLSYAGFAGLVLLLGALALLAYRRRAGAGRGV